MIAISFKQNIFYWNGQLAPEVQAFHVQLTMQLQQAITLTEKV